MLSHITHDIHSMIEVTSTDSCIEQAVVRLFFRLETLQILGLRV